MNQILTKKMVFTFKNIKDSSLNRNGFFNNGEWTYSLFDRIPAKISKFKLKLVYATINISMHSRASVEIRPKSRSLL
jgi:hypothetical protein